MGTIMKIFTSLKFCLWKDTDPFEIPMKVWRLFQEKSTNNTHYILHFISGSSCTLNIHPQTTRIPFYRTAIFHKKNAAFLTLY